MERVEPTEHVVERGENYWIISRQYWGSGRYSAALWKANSANHPYIDVCAGDVSSYLRSRTSIPTTSCAGQDSFSAVGGVAGHHTPSEPSVENRWWRDRSGRCAAPGRSNVPARRASSRSEFADDSDPGVTADGGDRSTAYKGRSAAAAKVFDGDDAGDDQEVRTAARPRGSAAGRASKPVYRVRPHDTLRKIARDMLGDSRRANEIYELNRGVIDDPGSSWSVR